MMDQIHKLLEEIKLNIEQLELLKEQPDFDRKNFDRVLEETMELIKGYYEIIKEQVEQKIQNVEQRAVITIGEEYQKRQDILGIVQDKKVFLHNALLGSDGSDCSIYIPELLERLSPIFDSLEKEIEMYQNGVELVAQQLEAAKKANLEEAELKNRKNKLLVEVEAIKSSQISYQQLDEEMQLLYQQFKAENNIDQIDINFVSNEITRLQKLQDKMLTNIKLAQSANNMESKQRSEESLKTMNLKLDQLIEKAFVYRVSQRMQMPVSSYQELRIRTDAIEKLIHDRKQMMKRLCSENALIPENYTTSADYFDHSKIYQQLNALAEMEKKEVEIMKLEDQIEHLRDHIKGKVELEEYFEQEAISIGRTPAKPNAELVEEIIETEKEPIANKIKVQLIEKAKPEMLTKLAKDKLKGLLLGALSEITIFSMKKGIIDSQQAQKFMATVVSKVDHNMQTQTNLEELYSEGEKIELANEELIPLDEEILPLESNYEPSIGDKIRLGDNAQVYSTSVDVMNQSEGYAAGQIGLTQEDLYVTRGTVANKNGETVYVTTEYGTDMNEIANNMGLEKGFYTVTLGCSIGDMQGNFVPVEADKLNPNIERGWISASDQNIKVIEQLKEQEGVKTI